MFKKIKNTFLINFSCTLIIEVIKLYDAKLREAFKKTFEEDEVPLTMHNIEVVLNNMKESVTGKLEEKGRE